MHACCRHPLQGLLGRFVHVLACIHLCTPPFVECSVPAGRSSAAGRPPVQDGAAQHEGAAGGAAAGGAKAGGAQPPAAGQRAHPAAAARPHRHLRCAAAWLLCWRGAHVAVTAEVAQGHARLHRAGCTAGGLHSCSAAGTSSRPWWTPCAAAWQVGSSGSACAAQNSGHRWPQLATHSDCRPSMPLLPPEHATLRCASPQASPAGGRWTCRAACRPGGY